MFQMLGVFSESEREIIRERVNSGLARAKAQGKKLGRPRRDTPKRLAQIRKLRKQALASTRSPANLALVLALCSGSLVRDQYKAFCPPNAEVHYKDRSCEPWLSINKISPPPRATMALGVSHLREIGITPKTIFDVGASNGSWSEIAMSTFPDAHYVLFEPQPCHQESLREFNSAHPNVTIIPKAVGKSHLFR
jgi:Resolvase, N terminal domain